MALTITPYAGQGWTDNSTPDLSAETLNAVDAGITANSNAINAIANAVVSQIVNDPNKIASMAALYAVNSNLNTVSNSLAKLNTATLLSDCDTANDTGLYYYNNSTSHTPVASTFGFVRHSKVVSWHYQEAFPTDGGYYIRRKIDSGAWTAWIAK